MLLWLAGIFLSMQAFAQGITVKGVVKDNTKLRKFLRQLP